MKVDNERSSWNANGMAHRNFIKTDKKNSDSNSDEVNVSILELEKIPSQDDGWVDNF
jgi:hypothetical protein